MFFPNGLTECEAFALEKTFSHANVEMSCCTWDFTINEERIKFEDLKAWCVEHCKKWAFQLEEGKKTGLKHYQIRVSLKSKKRKNEVLNTFSEPQHVRHLSPTSGANRTNEFYVTKSDTRLSGPWTDRDLNLYIPKQYRLDKLYPYQSQILETLSVFDNRHINIIVDENGGEGKSSIAAIAELQHDCLDVPCLNDIKDLVGYVCNHCSDRNIHELKGIFIDLPRAMPKCRLQGLYSGIEQIKKGKLYDLRYHTKVWWIDSPVIWVFTNETPNMEWLSNDRWIFWEITPDKKLKKI